MAVAHVLPVAAEERRLVDRAFDADDEAFDSIYRRYKPALLAFCTSRLGSSSEAEDACQETLLRAYRALPRFDRAQRLWPWLATIAANVCIDMHRRRRAVPLSACSDPRAEETVDPEDELATRMRCDLVGSAIRDLPEPYRRPLYLADLEGWSYEDIAAQEQKSLASVRSTLMRSRAAFKTRVQELAEERGMWPLSAILPFPGLRARYLAWRTPKEAGGLSSMAPSAFSVAQAAAAAIAVMSTVVPGLAAADASTDARVSHLASIVRIASTSAPAVETPPAPESRARATAPSSSFIAPSTAIDLDREAPSVSGVVGADTNGDGRAEVWGVYVGANCDYDLAQWRDTCDQALSAADELLP